MRPLSATLVAASLFVATAAHAARIFDGYAGVPWGTTLHDVMRLFPKGNLAKINDQFLYRQFSPNRVIFLRTFVFKEERLTAVSIRFNPDYVDRTGVETILAKHRKVYGVGTMDRSRAPHLLTYTWETRRSRLSFAYAPKRPDMTIMLYEKK